VSEGGSGGKQRQRDIERWRETEGNGGKRRETEGNGGKRRETEGNGRKRR
jgi:hypothetical protein